MRGSEGLYWSLEGVSSVSSMLPSLRREVSGSAESETSTIGLRLEVAIPFREVGDLADESHVTLSDSQK